MKNKLPTPPELHLPSKFKVWRNNQEKAILDMIYHKRDRFLMQIIPTGNGKSLIYTAAAWIMDGRHVFLTSTKGLMTQLVDDFAAIGVAEIKGRKSYSCNRGDGPTADHGLCHFGITCDFKEGGGCDYYDAVRRAAASRIVVTNYAYWMTAGDRLGSFDRVIMDEGHEAPRHLSDSLTVSINTVELESAIGMEVKKVGPNHSWGTWATTYGNIVASKMDQIQKKLASNPSQIWLLRKLFGFSIKLDEMKNYALGYAVMETEKEGFRIDPVHVAPYAPTKLFHGVPSIVLISATVTRKTAQLMGVEPIVLEYGSDFPISRRPVIHVPTISVSHRTTPSEEDHWLRIIDQIVKGRLDRKGIIHTVSYDRAQRILRSSKNRAIIRSNSSSTLALTINQFRKDSPPSVLLSPVVTTGWDFPYSDCEYQIISKVPFPDGRSQIMLARSKVDPEYPIYLTLQSIVQACGRGMRAADDCCETLVVDDNFGWLMRKHGKLTPQWFREAISWERTIPKPLPKLGR